MHQLWHPDEGLVANPLDGNLIAAKHTAIQLNILLLPGASQHCSLNH